MQGSCQDPIVAAWGGKAPLPTPSLAIPSNEIKHLACGTGPAYNYYMTDKPKFDIYGMVTERITAMLEAGTVPWRKPWIGGTVGAPKNLKSGKAYRGVNVFILLCQSYPSSYWLTYKQAADMGGTVRKGEKGTPIVFWSFFDDKKNPGKRAAFIRYSTVFNVAQCDGVKVPDAPVPTVKGAAEVIDAAEAIVANYLTPPTYHKGGSAAFYRPSEDAITMPTFESFTNPEEYYSTLFHEMGHSTGHHSRLDRSGVASTSFFGSHEYSKEELVAEMTAAFLSAEAGILMGTIENSAAYIASWLKRLKGDPKMFVQAAGEAQKAADLILGRKWEAPEPEAPATAE